MIAGARRMLDHGIDSLMARERATQTLTLDTLAHAAAHDDRVAIEVIDSAADYLAMAISNLVSILDISLVIVGGEVEQIGEPFFGSLRRALAAYPVDGTEARIVPAELEQDAALRGVSMLALQQVLGLLD
jgi:glucokinase